MKKTNKEFLMTALVIALPMVIGAIFWNQLPEKIPTHFGIDGQADGYSSKLFTLFAFPALFLLFQIICLASFEKGSVEVNIPAKMRRFCTWLIPVLSLIIQGSIYANALGFIKSGPTLVTTFLAIVVIVIGNYLPKIQRNATVGIRIPWTLSDDKNWYKTHRMAGKLWVIGGLIILLESFIQVALLYVMGVVIAVMIVGPIVYSFILSRKNSL